MGEERILKGKFILTVRTLEKVVDSTGKENLKVIGTENVKMQAKEFNDSLRETRGNGILPKLQIVTEEPEQFQLNTVYIRADRKRVWVNVLKEN